MKTLIIGIGALGGLIAARLRASGCQVWLATRDAEQADRLRASGLQVTGAGAVTVQATAIAPLDAYAAHDGFDLVLLATRAHDAIEAAPKLSHLLGPNAALLPIQNGGVPVGPKYSTDLREASVLGFGYIVDNEARVALERTLRNPKKQVLGVEWELKLTFGFTTQRAVGCGTKPDSGASCTRLFGTPSGEVAGLRSTNIRFNGNRKGSSEN